MFIQQISRTSLLLSGLMGLLLPDSVYSIPLFARQTGSPCSSCHTSFPELNSFGRSFKLRGYTLTESELSGLGSTEEDKPLIPLSAMVVTSYSKTKHKDATDTVEFEKDKKLTIQEASLFTGGRMMDNLGAFVQWTYDGIASHSSVDAVDIRYAEKKKLSDGNLIYGITLNNNPTLQDVWNTTPAWSFPYTGSDSAPAPTATFLEDGLGQQVGGVGVYALWDNWLYGEVNLYRQAKSGPLRILTKGTTIENVLDGVAPYWRLAFQYDQGENYFTVGAFGLTADVYLDGLSEGPTNQFEDFGLDAQYQFIGDPHVITAQASWIHEKQNWDVSIAEEEGANASDKLNSFKAKVSYIYKHYVGGTLGYFGVSGDADTALYSAAPVAGSRSGKPDSRGFIAEANFTPWPIMRIGLQYIAYDKFNGSKDNYDGFGRKASDNNTLYLYGWFVF